MSSKCSLVQLFFNGTPESIDKVKISCSDSMFCIYRVNAYQFRRKEIGYRNDPL